eukprot:CAMPEP_0173431618 /NCGR_PEP_ID=MMETSP1357-20121228/9702_1 /TAXON_ID=77926 /ORGANISM="Hemiselmis rufescens, Strain PCC563" /LENGTH=60 /DNA_ID=CAMNT_0014396117 /DNA_START=77 /DNA_END=259 /DNA_ORIENTATION=+
MLGPKPCVVINGSDAKEHFLIKSFSVGRDFTVGMCMKPKPAKVAETDEDGGGGMYEDVPV